MPELPEVEAVRRALAPAMVGATFLGVELRRRGLRRPFARGFARRLISVSVVRLDRRGKFLVAELSSGGVLIMHLGMSGAFRVEQQHAGSVAGPEPHDHVVFTMSSGAIITYNDPRRFGSMDLAADHRRPHPTLRQLGPEPLDPAFNEAALAKACMGRKTSIKSALLDQRVVAGVGNIYASEALHRAGLSPRRAASGLATADGAPRPAAVRLAAAIQATLRDAIARTTSPARYRRSRFRVYERDGEPCMRRGCKGIIKRITQAGRSTYFCPQCQR